jgi:hypothetical protein
MARRTTFVAVLAAAALGLSVPRGGVAAQLIYRCDDGRGGTLYADTPCTGATKVDIAPGRADPAAIERLRREQRAFDERQTARDLQARQDALAQWEYRLAQREWQLDAVADVWAGRPAVVPGYAWGGLWPWYPVPPIPPLPPLPPRPDLRLAPYVPAAPGRLGMPSPPPAPRLPSPPPIAPPAPRG